MGLYWSEKELKDYYRRTGIIPRTPIEPEKNEKRRSKYGNVPTVRNGRKFDSKHEVDIFDQLSLRFRAGEILGVICQHPFRLPGDTVYIADFVVLNKDRTFDVIDAKSSATKKDKVYRLKKRLMKKELGLDITEV